MPILWKSWSLIGNWYFQNTFCKCSRTSSGTARFNLELLSHHSSDLWRNHHFFYFSVNDSFKSFLWPFEVEWSLEVKLRSIEITWGHSRSKLKIYFLKNGIFRIKMFQFFIQNQPNLHLRSFGVIWGHLRSKFKNLYFDGKTRTKILAILYENFRKSSVSGM